MKNPIFTRSTFLWVLAFLSSLALATPGELDLGFGGTGRVEITSLTAFQGFSKILVQPDGKMLVVSDWTGQAGDALPKIVIFRFNNDGTLDTSFNGNGVATIRFNGVDTYPKDAILQPDGKIVVAGFSYDGVGGPNHTLVARFNANGALDTSFNLTGFRLDTRIGSNSFPVGVGVLPEGKIVIAGHASFDATHGGFFVARYKIDGTPDTSLNANGFVRTVDGSATSGTDEICFALQPDGKVLIAGQAIPDLNSGPRYFAVVRFLSSGKLDTTFNGTGKVETSLGSGYARATGITVQSDGKIVVVGDIHQGGDSTGLMVAVRYTASGSLDGTFGTSGRMDLGSVGAPFYVQTALQDDGKIVVSGGGKLARLQSDGSPDPTFGTAGSTTGGVPPQVLSIAAGKVYVGGAFTASGFPTIERYLGDPTLPVRTLVATDVNANSATLRGDVNPEGENGVAAYFEWGLSPTSMSNVTPAVSVGNGTASVPVQAAISGLQRTTLYYYRLRTAPFVSNVGEVRNFITIAELPPGIISKPASSIAATGATLNSSINPNGLATTTYFEWGTTTSYGSQTATVNVPAGSTLVGVNALLTGLTTDQGYHFRAVATNAAGTSYGPDRIFVPSAGAPQPLDDVVLIDGVTTIHPLANDIDPNGDALTIIDLDPDAMPNQGSGSAQILGNLIFYTPTDGMLSDEFGYIVQDATGLTAKARVRAYRLSEIRGQYFGVLSQSEGTGKLSLELGPSGAFSLLLTWLGEDYAVKGRVASDGSFLTAVAGKGAEAGLLLLLELQYDPHSGQFNVQLTDSVIGGPFAFAAPRGGDADEAVDVVRGALYTTTIDVPDSVIALPESASPEALNPFADKFRGSGFASVKIAKNRSARFVGQMPDTAKFSAGSPVSRRTYSLYSALYQAKTGALGSVSGQATLQSNFELRGTSLTWQREADARDKIFNAAFNTPAFLNGDRYTPPTRGQLMQIGLELLSGAFSNAKLNLTLGGLAPELQQALKFIPGSVRVVGENPSGVKLRISPTTGTFSGSFLHTASQETTKFSGIFITSPFQIREGRGSFRGVGAGGKVRIAKP